jgi:ribose 5-phosphate isomerase B
MKIVIGSDHAGFSLKEFIKEHFRNNFEFEDVGTFSEESVDYPDFAHQLASLVSNGTYEKAILMCGSGNGVAMSANKHPNVRAALCWSEEIAQLARLHNDANVLVLPAR